MSATDGLLPCSVCGGKPVPVFEIVNDRAIGFIKCKTCARRTQRWTWIEAKREWHARGDGRKP